MSRIIYWNIDNFSLRKIQAAGAGAPAAAARLNYMLQWVLQGPAGGPIPDIIVVVEVHGRIREVGAEGLVLASAGRAGQAVLLLRSRLRTHPILGTLGPHATNWCVVPPINLGDFGQREAVAVFYNAANLQFIGPNILYPLYGVPHLRQSQPVNAVTNPVRIPYNAAWTAAMPAVVRTHVFPGFGAIPENQLAGEWQYYVGARPAVPPDPADPPANRIRFPAAGCRGPFLTRFLDLTVMPNRILNIFAVHTSPASAWNAVHNMQVVPEMAAVAANEVNVIVGDFNIDSFAPNADAYNWLAAAGGIYHMALDPRALPAPAISPARHRYCMTHLLPLADATPFNNFMVPTDPQHHVYPRFGYMGSSWHGLNNTGAIDNFFTVYDAALAPPANNNICVINTLTGKPYNLVAPPAGGGVTAELTGGPVFPSHILANNTLVTVPPAMAGNLGIDSTTAAAPGELINFRHITQFGIVRNVSDHLPLMMDV